MGRAFNPHFITPDSADGGDIITGSTRFRKEDTFQFFRTASSANNQYRYTISAWVKKTKINDATGLGLMNSNSGGSGGGIGFRGSGGGGSSKDDDFGAGNRNASSGSGNYDTYTAARYRDITAWGHYYIAFDSTLSTSTDRVKIYVNGIRQSDNGSATYPSQNYYSTSFPFGNTHETYLLKANYTGGNNGEFDGYVSEYYFADNNVIPHTAFGYTDPLTGIWKPKKYKTQQAPNDGSVFSNNWTASGNGFGSHPVSYIFDNDQSNFMNNSAGGQIITWNTSSYNLSGELKMFGRSSSGVYDVYVNGVKAADTPSSNGWFDCGTHTKINEIQFAGTSYNTGNGLGSAGIYAYMISVDGVILRDNSNNMGLNGFYLPFDGSSPIFLDQSGNNNDFELHKMTQSIAIEKATGAKPIRETNSGGTQGLNHKFRPDPLASNLVLAIPFDGKVEDVSHLIKGSGTQKTVNKNSSTYDQGRNAFYHAARYIYSAASVVTVGAHSDLDLGTGDFCLEFWIYETATSNAHRRWVTSTNAGFSANTFVIREAPNQAIGYYAGNSSTGNSLHFNNRWVHYGYTRASGVERVFRNGELIHTTTSSAVNYSEPGSNGLYIGGHYAPGAEYISGWMQDLRLYKGVAKYTEEFVPAAASYNTMVVPDSPSGVSTPMKFHQTENGSISFTRKISSGVNDGPNQNSYITTNSIPIGTNDFTIEGFIYRCWDGNYPCVVDTRQSLGDAGGFFWGTNSDDKLYYYSNSATRIDAGAGSIEQHRWYHVALVRDYSSTTTTMYIDGKSVGTWTGDNINYTRDLVRFGSNQGGAMGTSYNWDWNGLISNFRVTIGQVLYSSDFTPPTSPLTTTSQGATASNVKFLGAQSHSSLTAAATGTSTPSGSAALSELNPFDTDVDVSGQEGNYATLNSLSGGTDVQYKENNLYIEAGTDHGRFGQSPSTLAMTSGKYYCEVECVHPGGANTFQFGVTSVNGHSSYRRSGTNQNGEASGFTFANVNNGTPASRRIMVDGVNVSGGNYLPMAREGDVYGMAFDADRRKLRFTLNGCQLGHQLEYDCSQYTTGGSDGEFFFYGVVRNDSGASKCRFNFGQLPFQFNPPHGYRTLSSNNLEPRKIIPSKHIQTLLWTGTDHNYRNIHGLDFTPDLIWIKNRSQTDWHILSNSVDGFHNMMYSNENSPLNSDLNSNGYINGSIRGENGQGGISVNGQVGGNVNELNENYVAWCWKGGSPLTAPTSGSVLFSNDNNYLDLGSYTDFQFGTGDYTIEMFVYHTTLSGQQTYVGDAYGNSAGVYFYKDSNNKIGMYYSGQIATSSTNMPLMKWVHIAVSRNSGTVKLFQDGTNVGNGFSDTTNLTETQLNIGDTTGGSSGSMHGYISNVRILKGTGLYTGNFTPPTSPLTNISNTVFLGCQSETVGGLASVHPSPFSNNGTNYSSGSQLDGAITAIEGTASHGGPGALFDGKIGYYGSDTYASATLNTNNYIQFTPTSAISYTTKLEVWCYAANGYGITNYYSLNGASEQTFTGGGSNFNDQNWITIDTGSGTLTSLKLRLTRSGGESFVNWGAIRVDGCILVNDVTGKVVTPTMDGTRSVPASPKNPFDIFAVDGTAYPTAAAAGFTQGSVTVNAASVNTEGGFSVLTYSGTGSAGTIEHGLGKAPQFILTKRSDTNQSWFTYHRNVTAGSYLRLDTNAAEGADATVYPTTVPTSDVYYIGYDGGVNGSGATYTSYCWTSIPGYSKFGTYTGNGIAEDGTYVHLGFKPGIIIFKRTNATDNWGIFDSKRDTYNPLGRFLYPDHNYAEWTGGTYSHMDFLSNGFKVQNTGSMIGANDGNFVYMAWAEGVTVNPLDVSYPTTR